MAVTPTGVRANESGNTLQYEIDHKLLLGALVVSCTVSDRAVRLYCVYRSVHTEVTARPHAFLAPKNDRKTPAAAMRHDGSSTPLESQCVWGRASVPTQATKRQKSTCKECSGSQICEHDRRRSRCKECGETQITCHGGGYDKGGGIYW